MCITRVITTRRIWSLWLHTVQNNPLEAAEISMVYEQRRDEGYFWKWIRTVCGDTDRWTCNDIVEVQVWCVARILHWGAELKPDALFCRSQKFELPQQQRDPYFCLRPNKASFFYIKKSTAIGGGYAPPWLRPVEVQSCRWQAWIDCQCQLRTGHTHTHTRFHTGTGLIHSSIGNHRISTISRFFKKYIKQCCFTLDILYRRSWLFCSFLT